MNHFLVHFDDRASFLSDKICAFFINNSNRRKLELWLTGGYKYVTEFPTEERCRESYNTIVESYEEQQQE